MIDWDKKLFIYLNSLGKEKWDSFWLYITFIENWIPFYSMLGILFLYLFGFKKSFILFLTLVVMVFCVYLTSLLFKHLIERPRPCQSLVDIDHLRFLITNCKKFGFPSTHASLHFALAIFLGKLLRPYGMYIPILFFLWASLVAYSRIYVGVHYLSDIIAGMIIGISFGFLFFFLSKKLFLKTILN